MWEQEKGAGVSWAACKYPTTHNRQEFYGLGRDIQSHWAQLYEIGSEGDSKGILHVNYLY